MLYKIIALLGNQEEKLYLMSEQNSWQDQKESTSPFGMNIIIICYKLFGLRITLAIVNVLAYLVVLSNAKVYKISQNYLLTLKAYAKSKKINLPSCSPFSHVATFCRTLFFRGLAWDGLIQRSDKENIEVVNTLNTLVKEHPSKLIISAHIGTLDVLRALNAQKNPHPVNIVMWTKQSAKLQAFFKKLNASSNLHIIEIDEINPNLAINIQEKLAHNEWVVIMADRMSANDSRYVEVDFLGEKARFPQGPWILALLLKASVLTLYHFETKNGSNLVYNDWGICSTERMKRAEMVEFLAQKYANELEEIVLKYPNHWFNFYDFWGK